MADLFTAATTVIEKVIELLGTVSTALMSNAIFQIMIGLVIFFIVMGIVFSLVRRLRKGGR